MGDWQQGVEDNILTYEYRNQRFLKMSLYIYARPFVMDPLGCPETSVTTRYTLLKIQKERRSNFHRGGSLKSRMILTATFPLL